ncbi:hypothetical protein, partial [Mameliella alba]|uniref:hypothetical protein n=1 Tax=Mameliella alba TaxID=561184 RepID=UPI001E592371
SARPPVIASDCCLAVPGASPRRPVRPPDQRLSAAGEGLLRLPNKTRKQFFGEIAKKYKIPFKTLF